MRLTAEDCAATFNPVDGGRLASFVVGDHELLVAQGKDVFHFGSFVMAPWVGRLRDARLDYGGAQHRFTANAGPHALHGLVTERPWHVTGDGELSIELGDPGLGRAGWSSTLNSVRGERHFASRCTRARPCQPPSAGILGLSVVSAERRNPPNLNLTLSPG